MLSNDSTTAAPRLNAGKGTGGGSQKVPGSCLPPVYEAHGVSLNLTCDFEFEGLLHFLLEALGADEGLDYRYQ